MHIDEVAVLSGHSDEVWNLAWSNDGSRLATASKDNTAKIWNTEVNTHLTLYHIHIEIGLIARHQPYSYIASLTGHTTPVSQLAWSPDDTLLLTVSESSIMIWDTQVRLGSYPSSYQCVVAYCVQGPNRFMLEGVKGAYRCCHPCLVAPRRHGIPLRRNGPQDHSLGRFSHL